MIFNNILNEIKINESSSDFLIIQQKIVDMFKHNNPRNIIIKLFNNYKDFVDLVKGQDVEEEEPKKKKEEFPKKEEPKSEKYDIEKVKKLSFKKEEPEEEPKKKTEEFPNLEGAVAVLLKRVTGEDIELDLDRYYTVSGRKKSDILSDTKLIKTIANIKAESISDEKRLLMPLFQVNIKLDEYLSNKRHVLSINEKQKIILAVFWILLIDNKYIPSDEKLDDIIKKYGQTKSIKVAKMRNKKSKEKEEDRRRMGDEDA
jgi:hypothetical protein